MVTVGPTSNNVLSRDYIVAISCDADDYSSGQISLTTVINRVIADNVTGIVFYSTAATTCNITGNYGDFDALYAMTRTTDSMNMIATFVKAANYAGGYLNAEILTLSAFDNLYYGSGNSTPGTAVAMIILYSITGLITALFLSIIITGAIRAHRHPERYGRRDFLGRPTQSRARGLARAILETLPIVKFGEGDKPVVKEAGTELVEASNATSHSNPDVTTATNYDAPTSSGAQEPRPTSSDADTNVSLLPKQETTTTITSTAATTTNPPAIIDNDSSLGCSICTDDFEPGQDLRVLPCSHKFHPACVDPWLLDVSGTCPLCRVDLRPARTNSISGEETANTLAPPLGRGGVEAAGTRRARLGGFFAELRRVQAATPQERIAALRRLRLEGRIGGDANASASAVRSGDGITQGAVDGAHDGVENGARDTQRRASRLRGILGRSQRTN